MLCQPEELAASATDVTDTTRLDELENKLDRILAGVIEQSSSVMAVRQNRGVSLRGDMLRCFNCRAFGHIARYCRKSRHLFPQNCSIVCFHCGKGGHIQRTCL